MESYSMRRPLLKQRRTVKSDNINILTDIYQEDVNLAVWNRTLHSTVTSNILSVIDSESTLSLSLVTSLAEHTIRLSNIPKQLARLPELISDIENLAEMFCCLFGLNEVGIRMEKLTHAMCPNFHVDRVPCRLVTTYYGKSTHFVAADTIDRTKANWREQIQDFEQITSGDVALLKGEAWHGNENFGIIHRSPEIHNGECRILLTMDFVR